jgi:glycosyltransferase involved in cell wall biosynthesis
VHVSYPAIDVASYVGDDPSETERVLARRGLERDGYVLFLSRLAAAKGVDDLIAGYAMSRTAGEARLVIAGNGPNAPTLRALAAASPAADRITFMDDVDDAEKSHLMAGSLAYVLPSKPRPEFVETFGIALVEKMLSGGGPVITTDTGGIGEAVGGCALIVPIEDPAAIARALDRVVLEMSVEERADWERRGREYGRRFDRSVVLDGVLARVDDLDRDAAPRARLRLV